MADRQFSDGELIYRLGDPADGVYRVRSGGVRLQRGGGDTSELSYLGADAVFGETGFLTGETRDTDAVAVGDVQVEFLRRNEFLAILSVQPHLLSATFEPVFNLVRSASADMPEPDTSHAGHLESADIEDDDISPAEIPSHGSAPDTLGIRLVLAGRRLRAGLGAEEIAVRELPFRIGRAASGEGKDTYDDVHLAITDARPFNLSRRHFSIEEENGALLVRDCGSYHGTTLNGQILGGEGRPSSAPLMSGESELVAGRADSPFRFRILVR